jgi:ubiquinone/menaquinone biosynthesis C-methylase UbiE
MKRTLAQNMATWRGGAFLYEYIIHPVFLRLFVFTDFYRFTDIYRILTDMVDNFNYVGTNKVTIFDMACGTFWFGRERLARLLMQDISPLAIGIDLSEKMIRDAKEVIDKKDFPPYSWMLKVADAQELGFKNEIFDEIWLCGALHQIPNQSKTIQEVARLLKPGGLFFCQTCFESRIGFLQKMQSIISSKSGFAFLNRDYVHDLLLSNGLKKLGWKESGWVGLFAYEKEGK